MKIVQIFILDRSDHDELSFLTLLICIVNVGATCSFVSKPGKSTETPALF